MVPSTIRHRLSSSGGGTDPVRNSIPLLPRASASGIPQGAYHRANPHTQCRLFGLREVVLPVTSPGDSSHARVDTFRISSEFHVRGHISATFPKWSNKPFWRRQRACTPECWHLQDCRCHHTLD